MLPFLEPAFGGSMIGRDIINMIKATMERADIPITLYAHVPIESEREARTIHGADDFVVKGCVAADLARVIQSFQGDQ